MVIALNISEQKEMFFAQHATLHVANPVHVTANAKPLLAKHLNASQQV